jgi:hypothetical protein
LLRIIFFGRLLEYVGQELSVSLPQVCERIFPVGSKLQLLLKELQPAFAVRQKFCPGLSPNADIIVRIFVSTTCREVSLICLSAHTIIHII